MIKFNMVEIYKGKDPVWKGHHNFLVGDTNCIVGPVDPETSKAIFEAIENAKADGIEEAISSFRLEFGDTLMPNVEMVETVLVNMKEYATNLRSS